MSLQTKVKYSRDNPILDRRVCKSSLMLAGRGRYKTKTAFELASRYVLEVPKGVKLAFFTNGDGSERYDIDHSVPRFWINLPPFVFEGDEPTQVEYDAWINEVSEFGSPCIIAVNPSSYEIEALCLLTNRDTSRVVFFLDDTAQWGLALDRTPELSEEGFSPLYMVTRLLAIKGNKKLLDDPVFGDFVQDYYGY